MNESAYRLEGIDFDTAIRTIAYRERCGDEMRVTLILASATLLMFLATPQDAQVWHSIVPLRSTRTQVEGLLGVIDTKCECYLSESEIVRIKYSLGPCKGVLAGWNVPADTVLSVEITPQKPLMFSELNIRKEDFVKTIDDTVTAHYGNGEKGVRYAISSFGKVESIWRGPSLKDNHLRCAGFPLTDGGITAYLPYDKFSYKTVEDANRLGEFGIRLRNDLNLKGYVIVYGARDKSNDTVAEFVRSAKRYLIDELEVDSKALEVINGGDREERTVELFLIPREWPAPVPTPTLGGFTR